MNAMRVGRAGLVRQMGAGDPTVVLNPHDQPRVPFARVVGQADAGFDKVAVTERPTLLALELDAERLTLSNQYFWCHGSGEAQEYGCLIPSARSMNRA